MRNTKLTKLAHRNANWEKKRKRKSKKLLFDFQTLNKSTLFLLGMVMD